VSTEPLPEPVPLLDPPPDSAVLRELLTEQAPHLAGLPLTQLPGGRDNAAVRIGDELVARLPLHALAVPLMRTEHRWLPRLAPLLPLATSTPVVRGEPGSGYPFPWSVAHWIDGDTADRTPYDEDEAADSLLTFLHALHRPAPADAPINPVRSVPLSERLPRFREHVAALDHPRAGELIATLEQLAAVPVPEPTPRLWCHGDLHPRNIVVRNRRLVGVIDWGDLHGGDPVVDYASAWMLLPENLVERVRRELHADPDTWARARGWALVFGVLLMRIGEQDGDPAFHRTGEQAVERAMSSGEAARHD
jgi:aminoglycoside phosphotransferase (APT) family kinase protein